MCPEEIKYKDHIIVYGHQTTPNAHTYLFYIRCHDYEYTCKKLSDITVYAGGCLTLECEGTPSFQNLPVDLAT